MPTTMCASSGQLAALGQSGTLGFTGLYEVERVRVAELVRAVVGFPAVRVADEGLVLRTLEIYEQYRIHFAESYLAASAELSGVGVVASFDRDIDRVPSIRRLEPGA